MWFEGFVDQLKGAVTRLFCDDLCCKKLPDRLMCWIYISCIFDGYLLFRTLLDRNDTGR